MGFHSIREFEQHWRRQAEGTRKLLAELTDASLSQAVGPEGRTIARLAWHMATTIPEMLGRTGLKIAGPVEHDPVPATAVAVRNGYDDASRSAAREVTSNWTDPMLAIEDEMYGERWKRGETLLNLILHEVHHRGQMTVLMRQAGLKVPGLIGPAREEWAQWGMTPPAV